MAKSVEQIRREAATSLRRAQERRERRAERRIRQFLVLMWIVILLSIAFGVVIINTGGTGS